MKWTKSRWPEDAWELRADKECAYLDPPDTTPGHRDGVWPVVFGDAIARVRSAAGGWRWWAIGHDSYAEDAIEPSIEAAQRMACEDLARRSMGSIVKV